MTPSVGTREAFAERFALLYAEAGKPPLDRVEQWVLRARRIDERGRPVRVSKQRLSDWRRGRNVPARFSALSVTLEVLIAEARKARPAPVVEQLYDLTAWRTLWETALKPAPAAVSEPDPGFCPYRGLASFRPEDADWFFGRERSTSELLSRLSDGADGFIMLVAASGAGKSSLLRAGLLPALEDPGSAVIMNPGATPMAELVPDGSKVIIVDQFEEIFTLCDDETERRRFIKALHDTCGPGTPGRPRSARTAAGPLLGPGHRARRAADLRHHKRCPDPRAVARVHPAVLLQTTVRLGGLPEFIQCPQRHPHATWAER